MLELDGPYAFQHRRLGDFHFHVFPPVGHPQGYPMLPGDVGQPQGLSDGLDGAGDSEGTGADSSGEDYKVVGRREFFRDRGDGLIVLVDPDHRPVAADAE